MVLVEIRTFEEKKGLFSHINCLYCGVSEGELHTLECLHQDCPFCGYRIDSCSCRFEKFGYNYNPDEKFSGLPKNIFVDGLGAEDLENWYAIIEKKGRIPFINFPNICARCGELNPELFEVPDEEWNEIIPILYRKEVICLDCYKIIKAWRVI